MKVRGKDDEKRNHDDDFELQEMDKARILVSIIPVILIIVILAVTLVMDRNKKSKTGAEDVQQSMIDYADESTPSDRTVSSNEVADATPNKENAEEREESEVLNKEEGRRMAGWPALPLARLWMWIRWITVKSPITGTSS